MADQTRKITSNTYPIGELLGKPLFYRVPVYQRDFAWTIEQLDALWDDITSALSEGQQEYFLGAIVLSFTDQDNKREIVDGQQRLAALSMIFAGLVRAWRELNDEKRASGVFRDYLGTEDRRTGELVSKLTLNETNDPVFQRLVIRGESASDAEKKLWTYSNKLLGDMFNRIAANLQTWLKKYKDTESALLDLEDFLAKNTNLIVIEAGDESDAFIIFETLNDRGLELAVADLVKNYLFSQAGGQIEKFKRTWTEIAVLIGNENMTQFLRHFWLSEYELVRERDLYRALRAQIKSPTKARQFMERVRKAADLYAALMNPEHIYWADFNTDVRNHFEALLLFKVTQFRPVALAAMDKLSPDIISKVLRMLMIISFRYTVVSSLGTGNLEKIYAGAALAISQGNASSVKDVFEKLRPAYVNDDSFANDFTQKKFSKAGIARYILAEINDHLEKDPEHIAAERLGRLTLEHIMPKNPDKNWHGSIPKDTEVSDYVELIGNLTLLEKGKNRGIGNLSFAEKQTNAFSTSTLAINQELRRLSGWDADSIETRSKKYAN
jgi:uncharacterized protein with ParB-like and HNH nuclease domain